MKLTDRYGKSQNSWEYLAISINQRRPLTLSHPSIPLSLHRKTIAIVSQLRTGLKRAFGPEMLSYRGCNLEQGCNGVVAALTGGFSSKSLSSAKRLAIGCDVATINFEYFCRRLRMRFSKSPLSDVGASEYLRLFEQVIRTLIGQDATLAQTNPGRPVPSFWMPDHHHQLIQTPSLRTASGMRSRTLGDHSSLRIIITVPYYAYFWIYGDAHLP
jgi:hypothetical protein